jgi:hypothetical protein
MSRDALDTNIGYSLSVLLDEARETFDARQRGIKRFSMTAPEPPDADQWLAERLLGLIDLDQLAREYADWKDGQPRAWTAEDEADRWHDEQREVA